MCILNLLKLSHMVFLYVFVRGEGFCVLFFFPHFAFQFRKLLLAPFKLTYSFLGSVDHESIKFKKEINRFDFCYSVFVLWNFLLILRISKKFYVVTLHSMLFTFCIQTPNKLVFFKLTGLIFKSSKLLKLKMLH